MQPAKVGKNRQNRRKRGQLTQVGGSLRQTARDECAELPKSDRGLELIERVELMCQTILTIADSFREVHPVAYRFYKRLTNYASGTRNLEKMRQDGLLDRFAPASRA